MSSSRPSRFPRTRKLPALPGLAAVTAAALTAGALTAGGLPAAGVTSPAAASATTPAVTVTTIAKGLSFPWDLSFTPDGTMLFDERPGRLWARTPSGIQRQLKADESDLFVGSESGLEGLVGDPAFASNRRFYTCQAYKGRGSSPIDVRVIRWTVDAAYTTATRVGAPVVTGLPITSGRHAGCRLRFAPDGTLHVGTGDAATGTNPQDLESLGGKTLRVNADGTVPTGNPFYAKGGNARYVYTYGHRNVQGLALQPGVGQMWTVEHGPNRDDEVNLEQAGGNYGWDPVPGYNESTPMTDLTKFPGAIRARWSSGYPTVAPSGGTFLTGSAWGRWQGALAVGILKDTGVMVLTVDPGSTVVRSERIPALQNGYGRIRAAQLGPDHSLYLTTSNGSNDKILRVTPTAATSAYHPGLDVSPVGTAAALRPDGVLGVVVRGTNGMPYAMLHKGPSSSGWQQLPGSARISSPAVVSTGGARLDAFAHDNAGALLHWVYDGARWGQPENLGGILTTAPAAVMLISGTVDVVARGADNALWRKRFSGSWHPWTKVGGVLSSAPGTSADSARQQITVVARGTSGGAYRAVLSATGTVSGFASTGATLWSAQSLAAAQSADAPYALDTSFDGAPVLTRGAFVDALPGRFTGAPAVTQQLGIGPVVVGRGTNGSVYECDLTAGHCAFRNLGGQVA